MDNILDLKDKKAVVTGGTSGIGKAIVDIFYRNNADVAFIGRDQARASAIMDNLLPEDRGSLSFYSCDVSKRKEVKSTCEKILGEFGRVDIIVLNSGIEYSEPVGQTDLDHWDEVFAVNTDGAFYFIRFLLDSMLKNKKGSIILISSAVTINGGGGGIAYSASKAALKGISSKLNYELLPQGIRTNIISPGVIDTPMFRKKNPDNPEINKKLISQIPARRIGKPEDIASMALFLASDHSSFICGQDIVIDGGRTVYRNPHLS